MCIAPCHTKSFGKVGRSNARRCKGQLARHILISYIHTDAARVADGSYHPNETIHRTTLKEATLQRIEYIRNSLPRTPIQFTITIPFLAMSDATAHFKALPLATRVAQVLGIASAAALTGDWWNHLTNHWHLTLCSLQATLLASV